MFPSFDEQLAALTVSKQDIAAAGKILRRRLTGAGDLQAERLKLLSDATKDPIAALAHWLTDRDLGDSAAELMLDKDFDRAAPLVFASMPRSDRNVQYHTFVRYERLAFAGPVCCAAEARQAALRSLDAKTNADAAEQALYVVGLTGLRRDIATIAPYLTNDMTIKYWHEKLRYAAQGAMARLGDKDQVEAIRVDLEAPVPSKIDFDRAVALSATISNAGFSRDRSLLAAVCRHLDDPVPVPDSDNLPPTPSQRAALAVAALVPSTTEANARATCKAETAR